MRPAVVGLSFACLVACVGEGGACGRGAEDMEEQPCGGGVAPLPGLPLELACTLVREQQALRSPVGVEGIVAEEEAGVEEE